MDWPSLLDKFRQLDVGKRVGTSLYLHVALIPSLPDPLRDFVEDLPCRVGLTPEDANVIKVDLNRKRVSLLSYPGFWDEGFPRLATSWTLDLNTNQHSCRRYNLDNNPPILHRKELLIPADHAEVSPFQALTEAAEQMGLFADTQTIGRLDRWNQELAARGLCVQGHQLLRLEDPRASAPLIEPPEDTSPFLADDSSSPDLESDQPQQTTIHRHKTAITRRTLSAPVQALWRYGFLDGRYVVFDYGCGHGDDVRALTETGLTVGAWDPHFRSDGEKHDADVVNLGFVINVIEDPRERREALQGAFALSRHVLAVSTLIGGRQAYEKFRLFRDGVLTSIGTFQKYYTQTEFEEYVKDSLGREPVTIAPGVLFVFKTDEQEQDFLALRQRQRWRVHARNPMPRAPRRERPPRQPRAPRPQKVSRWVEHAELLDDFWSCCLDLGRQPEPGEYTREPELRDLLGPPRRVLNHLLKTHGAEALGKARDDRMGDTCVYLALNFFERRRSFGTLSTRLKLDVKAFWGSYKAAMDEAQRLLFSVGSTEVIHRACVQAAEHGLGHLDKDHSLQLHSSLVTELPPVLRIYLGCATKLYGDVEEADLLKIHIQSGKVSLMLYDDFEGSPLPNLIERVKIDLRRRHIDFFEYGDKFPPQPIYLKSRFIYEGFDHYDEQKTFDLKLEALNLFDFSEFGPSREMFSTTLKQIELEVKGFTLTPAAINT